MPADGHSAAAAGQGGLSPAAPTRVGVCHPWPGAAHWDTVTQPAEPPTGANPPRHPCPSGAAAVTGPGHAVEHWGGHSAAATAGGAADCGHTGDPVPVSSPVPRAEPSHQQDARATGAELGLSCSRGVPGALRGQLFFILGESTLLMKQPGSHSQLCEIPCWQGGSQGPHSCWVSLE